VSFLKESHSDHLLQFEGFLSLLESLNSGPYFAILTFHPLISSLQSDRISDYVAV